MANYGTNTTAVFGNNCTITTAANVYALGVGIRVEAGNELIRQITTGTDKTVIGVGAYTGTITIDTLFCTDGDFVSLTEPSGTTGQLTEATITIALKNSVTPTQVTKTVTIKAYLNKFNFEQRENAFVRHGVRGEITNNTSRAAIA